MTLHAPEPVPHAVPTVPRAYPSLPSAKLCRAQERHHLDRAADTDLGNVRKISRDAAAAWGHEAVAAERREERHLRVHAARAVAAEQSGASVVDDRMVGEDPDIGLDEA